ncbi:MAG: putative NEK protein kinase [Streblomastix strix]|uniref:non-specific serine/threonine protein kinase n=1 Tax=Streblomastix strix TaxID=222440 RepID=A0A5J4WAX4_9EUKA|nr:MAG: putative NEK protein kinase [Streblomastix strix]
MLLLIQTSSHHGRKLIVFRKLNLLGRGTFGEVYLQKEKSTDRDVAIKRMLYVSDQDKAFVNRELSFLPIVKPLGFFLNDRKNKAFLVMEYCANRDIRRFIESMKVPGTEITPQRYWEIVAQIAYSLNLLHINGIIHLDLKPDNILLTKDYKVKITDFGFSRQLQVGREYVSVHGGTLIYQAPELLLNFVKVSNQTLKGNEQDKKSQLIQTKAVDIWSFGVILFELLAQKHPFFDIKVEANLSEIEIISRIVSMPPALLPEHYPLRLKELIKQMLLKDPSQRISADQILMQPEVIVALNKK